jgi:two-component system, NarL family, response regulator NreC
MADNRDSVRVLVAVDDPVARSRLRALHAGSMGIHVIAEASSPEQAASIAARLRPRVVAATFANSNGDGAASMRLLATVAPDSRVLVLTSIPADERAVLAAIDAGVAGVVSSQATPDELLSAIRAVATDHVILPRGAVTAVLQLARNAHASPEVALTGPVRPFALLTGRERSVFRMTAEGYSAPEVADRLRISKKTVETYKRRIGEKLGLYHRADYVRFALRVGVLRLSRKEA